MYVWVRVIIGLLNLKSVIGNLKWITNFSNLFVYRSLWLTVVISQSKYMYIM